MRMSGHLVGDWWKVKYRVCPEFVQVQTLFKLCQGKPRAVNGRVNQSGDCLECPCPMFVQNMSKVRKFIFLNCSNGQCLDKYWISMSKVCQVTSGLDRICTNCGQQLDRPCTLRVIGQTLDRVLTEIGQRLDFSSKLCPTTRRWGAPYFACVLVYWIK